MAVQIDLDFATYMIGNPEELRKWGQIDARGSTNSAMCTFLMERVQPTPEEIAEAYVSMGDLVNPIPAAYDAGSMVVRHELDGPARS